MSFLPTCRPTCTGTCVRTYFRQFVVSLKKFQDYYVLFYQKPEPALDKKFPEPPQNRPAQKPCKQVNKMTNDSQRTDKQENKMAIYSRENRKAITKPAIDSQRTENI